MDLGTALASSWSAGISLYGVLALLGIAGRVGWVDSAPFLEQTWVIVGALVLFAVELVVDKVALLDTVWDAVHTVLRPAAGALLAASAPDVELPTWGLVLAGGGLALSSHAAKASARALVNASPEPASNVVVSTVEDVVVAGVMALALAFPEVALAVTVVLGVLSTVTAVLLFQASRAVWRKLREQRAASRDGPAPPPAPAA